MRIVYYFALTLIAILVGSVDLCAQMKTGANPTLLNPNAVFEMESINRGMLLPRVQLTSDTSSQPLSAHVPGMVVYNIDTAGTSGHQVYPGVYFNTGGRWIPSFDKETPKLTVDRQLVTITSNGQSILNFPLGFPSINNDSSFFLYRNGVLLIKDVDYTIINNNQIEILNKSFNLSVDDELYAILKTLK